MAKTILSAVEKACVVSGSRLTSVKSAAPNIEFYSKGRDSKGMCFPRKFLENGYISK